MKNKNILALFVLLFISSISLADRELNRTETLQLLQTLTNQHCKTWIPAGTIEATHQEYKAPKTADLNEINNQISQKVKDYQNNQNKKELTEDLQKMALDAIGFNVRYKLANEYTMNSAVIVKYDGEKFYWEINVKSRTDSVKPNADLAGNFMTDQFDLNWNGKRIFTWDGEKYTTYFLPGNQAIIDTTGSTPHVVNGPLTAGVIPWGYGLYTYENLSSLESSAVEENIDGYTQIRLTFGNMNGSKRVFIIDPLKNYAVISCSITDSGNSVVSQQCSGYQMVSGKWVPNTILLEKYEAGSNRLLASDLWNITSIDSNVPESHNFAVKYGTDALIEHHSNIGRRPAIYRYSEKINTDLLLTERLAFAVSEGTQPQNCATAALKYVASQLGKDVDGQQLAQLISDPNKDTSLYAMKQFAQNLGLYCRAVKTDIQSLRNLSNCKVILHIPGKKHFVVLGDIDDESVWCIDVANNKFYYNTDINIFGMDWTEGVALIISNQSIQGEFSEIEDAQLGRIVGSAGYSCTVLRQEYNVIFCDYIGGLCGGLYYEYYERWGCASAPSGSCPSYILIRYKTSLCIEHPDYPDQCTITGEWTCYYMRACA